MGNTEKAQCLSISITFAFERWIRLDQGVVLIKKYWAKFCMQQKHDGPRVPFELCYLLPEVSLWEQKQRRCASYPDDAWLGIKGREKSTDGAVLTFPLCQPSVC